MRIPQLFLLVLLTCLSVRAETVTLKNPTKTTHRDEIMQLPIAALGDVRVLRDGKEVPSQRTDGSLWIMDTLEPEETATYIVEEGKPARFTSSISLVKKDNVYLLDNGNLTLSVPARAATHPPAPIQAVRVNGRWAGSGVWRTTKPLKAFSAVVLDEGPLFAKIRLRYEFEGLAGLNRNVPAFSQVDVSLFSGQHHAVIEESHEMDRGDGWMFDCAAGWKPRSVLCVPHSGGFDRPALGPWPPDSLKTGQTRMGDKLLNLMPRWTQAYDEGWFFACHDGNYAVGALTCHAGRWHWPHNNMIEVKVKESCDYAGLSCPTWKGRRKWFLLAGPVETWPGKDGAKEYVRRHAFETLDKLNRDYVLEWPGVEKGGFQGKDFFNNGMNPTGAMRGYGKGAMRSVGKPGNVNDLTHIQVLFDNDAYGSYWNYWSPENPNFFTDFMRGPIAKTTQLKGHPAFKRFARLAEQKLREDLYHSITLPGGAGQECPGYVAHAMKSWEALAPVCKQHLGFDPTRWPRFREGASFLLRVSQPIAPGERRCHPGGDTHPTGPDVTEVARNFGVKQDLKQFRTEELPGFGVVFRNRPGTDRETYLAFKSGPNRGHFHGDQLSFHYCANARQVAIDHMCSYSPRAGQEHMHNRVAFHTEKLPWANMDGYERVIAFKTSKDADVAVGQVDSERLRVTTEYPPEGWDVYLPEQRLDTPLKYRRTMVCVKNGDQDYFVVRDQYAGPQIKASYCLHVLSDRCERKGNRVDFGNLTLFCAEPDTWSFGRHDWLFEKKDRKSGQTLIREDTRGVRLTVDGRAGEFITVLYPCNEPPRMESIDGGVRVGEDEIVFSGGIDEQDSVVYMTVRRHGKELIVLTGKDLDLDRSQGDIGLFVPDAGYPFGVIPDWLIKQRSKVPEWAPNWVKEHRRYELP